MAADNNYSELDLEIRSRSLDLSILVSDRRSDISREMAEEVIQRLGEIVIELSGTDNELKFDEGVAFKDHCVISDTTNKLLGRIYESCNLVKPSFSSREAVMMVDQLIMYHASRYSVIRRGDIAIGSYVHYQRLKQLVGFDDSPMSLEDLAASSGSSKATISRSIKSLIGDMTAVCGADHLRKFEERARYTVKYRGGQLFYKDL